MDIKDLNFKVTVNKDKIDETLQKLSRLKELFEEVNSLISSIQEINLEIKVGSEL